MRLLVLLLLLASLAQARAQQLEVSPVSVTLGPGQRTGSLTVTNRGDAAITMQVRAFEWREDHGKSELLPTAGLAVSPPFAEVGPGQPQTIRLLLRQAPGAAEATYRLLVDELPATPNTPGVIRVALRLSLPVFAEPVTAANVALDWQIVLNRGGATLEVHNRGTRHSVVTGVQILTARGPIAVRTAAHPYILAGATVEWPIANSAGLPVGGSVRLKVAADSGSLDATAPTVSGSP